MAVTNPLWERLAALRPGLPRHIEFQRRDYNGELWYLLQDKSSGKFHRLTPVAYRLLSFMDGQRSLTQILTAASADLTADDRPTQEDLIHLLQYLHVADLLVCDMPPSTRELFARQQRHQQQHWWRLLANPLVWKIPLGNPDRLLAPLMPLARWLVSPLAGLLWLATVSMGVVLAALHWPELTHGQLDHIVSPSNLLLLWLCYALLKVVHELGHALVTKAWGGQVQECGLVIILGTPLPYVDASAATGFKFKHQRLLVGAAGIAVELWIAAIALLLWLQVQPGLLRDILYNLMLIGGVSTLFFNGNPLMRYDGYHLLTDAIDQPNLASRADQYLSYLMRRYAYGMSGLNSPAANRSEAGLFAIYGVLARAYRLFVLATIILLAAHYFPKFGLVLAIWLLGFQLLLPAINYGRFLLQNPALGQARKRALSVVGGSTALVLAILLLLPMPMATISEGVVWLPDQARIKAEAGGEIQQLFAKDGDLMEAGQTIAQLDNPALRAQLASRQASLREYETRVQQAWGEDRASAQRLEEEAKALADEVTLLEKRVAQLTLKSPTKGKLRFSVHHQLQGSYLQPGDSFALVETGDALRVRTALTQEEISLVQNQTRQVEIRLASQRGNSIAASVSQQVPAGSFELPSPVLGAKGGGRIALDANKPEGNRAAQLIFVVDVTAPGTVRAGNYGERAYVRFTHNPQPLGQQWLRRLQQLFIRDFAQSF